MLSVFEQSSGFEAPKGLLSYGNMKLHEVLRKRAQMFLQEAEEDLEKGFYDLASFHAEQALQLFLKAMLSRLSGEEVRGHEIRELLATLAFTLKIEGFEEESERLGEIAKRFRRELVELEEAYYEARYKPYPYSKEEAEELVKAAKLIIEELRRVEEKISRWKRIEVE